MSLGELASLDACQRGGVPDVPACLQPCAQGGLCGEGLVCLSGVCVVDREASAASARFEGDLLPTTPPPPSPPPNVAPPRPATATAGTGGGSFDDGTAPTSQPPSPPDPLPLPIGVVPQHITVAAAPLPLADPEFQLSEEFSAWLISRRSDEPPWVDENVRVDGEIVRAFPPGLIDPETGALVDARDPFPYQFVCLLEAMVTDTEVVRMYFARVAGFLLDDIPEGLGDHASSEACRSPYAGEVSQDVHIFEYPEPAAARCGAMTEVHRPNGTTSREAAFSFDSDGLVVSGSVHTDGAEALTYKVLASLDTCIGDREALEAWIATGR